ncbi:MAG: hypothetical protein JXA24_07945 [Proteobacteria bacterium]|nr:hypothetical protein [Pseudomonadota bacterium]
MKRAAAVSLALFVIASSLCALAGEQGGAASARAEESGFAIIILGTRSAADVRVIEKNLRSLPYVSLMVPTVMSQQHLEFQGRMSASDEAMVADVAGLAQDRYEVKARREHRRGLVITLRKIKG